MRIGLKRAYDEPVAADGFRVLVERLWPRGLSKERAQIDWWAKDVAPSPALRQWYGHDPARWSEFRRRYRAELRDNGRVGELRQRLAHGQVTFVFASRERERSSATVLKEYLEETDEDG